MPAHEELERSTAALSAALDAFVTVPDASRLAVARESWRSAARAWSGVELYALRETMVLHGQIGKWPVNVPQIEAIIGKTGGPLPNVAQVAASGSPLKGLFAIEYLLYDPSVDDAALSARYTSDALAARRAAYLSALGGDVHASSTTLRVLWSDGANNLGARFAEAALDGGELNGSISMLTNEAIGLLETMANEKLGAPRGLRSYGAPAPESAQAWRSASSAELLTANLESIAAVFGSGTSAAPTGIAAYPYLPRRAGACGSAAAA
ncbi:hypothetical protein HC891_28475, partial [Candidatus Gracilibacteria bacterium]|nr:hypothetical protein [Candidatus Gracilibacteria bacterium]